MVSIVAGPGFGKTSLLAMSWHQQQPLQRQQAWLTCEPADASFEHLRAGIATALGLSPLTETRGLLDALWARSPDDVCLLLDDIHELPAGSPGAAWLAELIVDMSANVHVVLCGRAAGPVPISRLAVAGQVARLTEADLLFTDDELAEFAAARGVSPAAMAGTGGWPALAELSASTGDDLRIDFLWDEVLARVGTDRSKLLGQLSVCGGGDDVVLSALAGSEVVASDVVRGLPLVSHWSHGWVSLHPLWAPALRRILSTDEVRHARVACALVHQQLGRFSWAMQLLAEAEAWDDLFTVIAEAEATSVFGSSPILRHGDSGPQPHDFDRWYRLVPTRLRNQPAALLAKGIGIQAVDARGAADLFRRAAAGYKASGNSNGQLAAISREGVVRWWTNDMAGVFELYLQVVELVDAGVERGRALAAIGVAAIGHLNGDSAAVLHALNDLGDDTDRTWLPTVHWLRSVAYRREGDLASAHRELDDVEHGLGLADPQVEVARLRTCWLEGDVERVANALREHHQRLATADTGFLVREAAWEASARAAWLGDVESARELATSAPSLTDMPNVLVDVLEALAWAAIAIHERNEGQATAVLTRVVSIGHAALDQPSGWYWRDRAATVMLRVLVPEFCGALLDRPLQGSHVVADQLTAAFVAARAGDTTKVAALAWPAAGVVRAHMPARWVIELAKFSLAAGNIPPDEIQQLCETDGSLEDGTRSEPARLSVCVLGPLTVHRDGDEMDPPQLRRGRVRELLSYLVAHRRVRREVIATEMWPDAKDPGHNLRVTLNYLRQAIAFRSDDGLRSLVRSTGDWLSIDDQPGGPWIDLWQLDEHLDRAEAAERAVDVAAALRHYQQLMPLWVGEPFTDVAYVSWAEPVRSRVRGRYVAAALRAGELWLSAGDLTQARRAAERALIADGYCEPAHRLLARAHLAAGHPSAAREALAACVAALADLGVEPDATTAALAATLSAPG